MDPAPLVTGLRASGGRVRGLGPVPPALGLVLVDDDTDSVLPLGDVDAVLVVVRKWVLLPLKILVIIDALALDG